MRKKNENKGDERDDEWKTHENFVFPEQKGTLNSMGQHFNHMLTLSHPRRETTVNDKICQMLNNDRYMHKRTQTY